MVEQQRLPTTIGIDSRTGGTVGSGVVMHRPGMLTFSVIMMFVIASRHVLVAISAFMGSAHVLGGTGALFGANLFVWNIVEAIIVFVALYIGVDILRGGTSISSLATSSRV